MKKGFLISKKTLLKKEKDLFKSKNAKKGFFKSKKTLLKNEKDFFKSKNAKRLLKSKKLF